MSQTESQQMQGALTSVDERVSKIFHLYRNYGDSQYIGERISKTSHSIQCGMLAQNEGNSVETILGAFFHDIGHLIGEQRELPPMITDGINYGAQGHDELGESYLRALGFPCTVTDIVKGHVDAKRYLVCKDKDYYARLSDASKRTLEHQGGAMTEAEAAQFEQKACFRQIIQMRKWDEQAKLMDVQLQPLETFEKMSADYLTQIESA